MSLREVFHSAIRDKVYAYLRQGVSRGSWTTEFIYNFLDEIMSEKSSEITSYLKDHIVTLENMDSAAQDVAEHIILPYIYKKRVE